jgi:hypothetical protein
MKRHLFAAPHLAVAVCRYQPGERHKPHADVHSRISLLLRGGYREEGRLEFVPGMGVAAGFAGDGPRPDTLIFRGAPFTRV